MKTREADLSTKAARDRLPVRAEPHWRKLSEGEFVGYYRGQRSRKWVARIRQPGAATKGYAKATLGEADDLLPADGARVLSWTQAQAAAMQFFDVTRTGSPSGPYTVSQALDEYLIDLASRKTERAIAPTRHRAEAIIRPAFGAHEVAALSHGMIRAWHRARAASPARLRTGQYAATVNDILFRGDYTTLSESLGRHQVPRTAT